MPTLLRVDGFSFRIYPADHEPPHVHVFRAGMQAKILLPGESVEEAEVQVSYRMSLSELRRAKAIVEDYRDELLEAWRKYHGQ